jgi:hypothetical protein
LCQAIDTRSRRDAHCQIKPLYTTGLRIVTVGKVPAQQLRLAVHLDLPADQGIWRIVRIRPVPGDIGASFSARILRLVLDFFHAAALRDSRIARHAFHGSVGGGFSVASHGSGLFRYISVASAGIVCIVAAPIVSIC